VDDINDWKAGPGLDNAAYDMKRLESRVKVSVRGKTIGGRLPLICLPITAAGYPALIRQARETVMLSPDIIEWRADGFGHVDRNETLLRVLDVLRSIIGDIPLIFTYRSPKEGGFTNIEPDRRFAQVLEVAQSGLADIVDYELSEGAGRIEKLSKAIDNNKTKLLLSWHDFEATPDEGFIMDRFIAAQGLGANIAKVAAMANGPMDVLKLLAAPVKAKADTVKIPLVSIAMGRQGIISRLAGGYFGSDIIYASGSGCSAPGQINIQNLRAAWHVLGCGSEGSVQR
jgi:3-dehydroquinate dehydratase-1